MTNSILKNTLKFIIYYQLSIFSDILNALPVN